MNKVIEKIKYVLKLRWLISLSNWKIIRKNKVVIGENVKIYGKIFISNSGLLEIGDSCTITSGRNFNIIGGDLRCNMIVTKDAVLKIGKNVGISNSTIVCTKQIIIAEDVLIGGGCKIYDTDFHSLDYINRMNPFKSSTPDAQIKQSPVIIKKGAFIGGHSIILKGVEIGEYAVVGAGSVVTKNIPDNEVWGGNPAKFIKKIS